MIDFTKLCPAELRAIAYGLHVLMKMTDNYVLALDDKGQTFAVYTIPERKADQRTFWMRLLGVPDCVDICGYKLWRRHNVCRVCRWRKILKGKLPPVVPVTVYMLSMGKDRRFEKLQSWLGKKIFSAGEVVTLWGEQSKSSK